MSPQCFYVGASRCVLCLPDADSLEVRVLGVMQVGVKANCQINRFNTQKLEVKQRVDVCTEKEAILNDIGSIAFVR